MFSYKTQGTCSREIRIETRGDVIESVEFVGGCRGNTRGLAQLCAGMKVDDVIARCEGIPCQGDTSCPDQLARALRQLKAEQA